jgi:hypothetical protein
MTNPREPQRPARPPHGVKTLIAAASVAATLSGWAAFSTAGPTPAPVTDALTPIAEAIGALPPTQPVALAPAVPTFPALPTLVPAPVAQSAEVAQTPPALVLSPTSPIMDPQAPAPAPTQAPAPPTPTQAKAPPKAAQPTATARPRIVNPPSASNRTAPAARSRSSR